MSRNKQNIKTTDWLTRGMTKDKQFEALDKFRDELINKFIDLCRGNDFNKLTLLKIGDTIDQIYDKLIAEMMEDRND